MKFVGAHIIRGALLSGRFARNAACASRQRLTVEGARFFLRRMASPFFIVATISWVTYPTGTFRPGF